MAIHRIKNKKDNFTIISNFPFNDPNLSIKAKGLLIQLLSKPDDWVFYVSQLAKVNKEGKKSIYNTLKELKAAGYIDHIFIRDDSSRILRGEYIVYEDPKLKKTVNTESKPYAQKVNTAKGNTQNGTLQSTEKDQVLKNNNSTPKTKVNPTPSTPKEKIKPEVKTDQSPKPTPDSKIKSKSQEQEVQPDAVVAVLLSLFSLIPEGLRHSSIKSLINKALKQGHNEAYIKSAIQYANDNSKRESWQKYRSYLSQVIDNEWAEGYESEKKPVKPQSTSPYPPPVDSAVEKEKQKANDEEHQLINKLLNQVNLKDLDDFIEQQDLNPYSKKMFNKGQRNMLRRSHVKDFIDQDLTQDHIQEPKPDDLTKDTASQEIQTNQDIQSQQPTPPVNDPITLVEKTMDERKKKDLELLAKRKKIRAELQSKTPEELKELYEKQKELSKKSFNPVKKKGKELSKVSNSNFNSFVNPVLKT